MTKKELQAVLEMTRMKLLSVTERPALVLLSVTTDETDPEKIDSALAGLGTHIENYRSYGTTITLFLGNRILGLGPLTGAT